MASESNSHHSVASNANDRLTLLEVGQMVLMVAIASFGIYFVWIN